MRVRGILTTFALGTALVGLSPAIAATKPHPTVGPSDAPPKLAKVLKSHKSCSKGGVSSIRLCLIVRKLQATKGSPYIQLAASGSHMTSGDAIQVWASKTDGSTLDILPCPHGITACAGLLMKDGQYTGLRARIVNATGAKVAETSLIHLPLR